MEVRNDWPVKSETSEGPHALSSTRQSKGKRKGEQGDKNICTYQEGCGPESSYIIYHASLMELRENNQGVAQLSRVRALPSRFHGLAHRTTRSETFDDTDITTH